MAGVEAGDFVVVLYSFPRHHIGEFEAAATESSGSQKNWTSRLYRSMVVMLSPNAAQLKAEDVVTIDGRCGVNRGECGAGLEVTLSFQGSGEEVEVFEDG